MSEAARLAGFFAAHGIWCVSEGEPLIPMLGYQHEDGLRHMTRLVDNDLASAARVGSHWLDSNHYNAVRAVLVTDVYVTLPSGRTDALLLDVRDYLDTRQCFRISVPYRTHQHAAGFAVFRPKLLSFQGAKTDADYSGLTEAFFAGAEEHSQGYKVWNEAIDQSR